MLILRIKKGNYRNLSLSINNEGDIIIKSPIFLNDEQINKFYLSKEKWIKKHIEFFKKQINLKKQYDFSNTIYLYNSKFKNLEYNEKKINIYLDNFNKKIIPLVNEVSNIIGLHAKTINPIKSKRIWGSLNKKKEMKLNILISILPKNLVVYIIVHELCHLIEFNHSKKFWTLIKNNLPNYKEDKMLLGEYSFILRDSSIL